MNAVATSLFIFGVIVLIAAFDVWVWRMIGIDATITRVLRACAAHFPPLPLLLAFGMGYLACHLFEKSC